jgi:2-dehydro-3-deoxygluconokinase
VDVARAHNVTVSFDLNFRGNLWSAEEARSVYRDIIPLSDVVFAGDDEAAIAVGAGEPEELARRIAALGPSQAVIKLGPDGALALIEGTLFRQEAVTIDAVDTVGAGDAFVAGYLAEFVTGCGPQERLKTAAATGAFACLVPGDWEGFPRRHELPILQTREPVSR